jgi:hypothetical protein
LQTPLINIASADRMTRGEDNTISQFLYRLISVASVIIYFMFLLMNHIRNTAKWKWEFKAGPFLKLFPDDLLIQYRLCYRPKWDVHNPSTHQAQP